MSYSIAIQRLWLDGVGQERVHSARDTPLAILVAGTRGHRDHRVVLAPQPLVGTQPLDDLEAVKPRHLQSRVTTVGMLAPEPMASTARFHVGRKDQRRARANQRQQSGIIHEPVD